METGVRQRREVPRPHRAIRDAGMQQDHPGPAPNFVMRKHPTPIIGAPRQHARPGP
jgi:hypothetical protein